MNKRQEFNRRVPEATFIDSSDMEGISKYLDKQNFLLSEESVRSCEIPGAGNMNYVIRVKTNKRNFIIKQSRPWVEKYPVIEAPIDRIQVEAEFYKSLSSNKFLRSSSPEIYVIDQENYLMIMEDLGDVKDFSFVYNSEVQLYKSQVEFLASYLIELHQLSTPHFPDNLKMRELNHEHIFKIPFAENNGIDLNAIQLGLQELSIQAVNNTFLKEKIHSLGELYLQKGDTLVHGDFYPGSWMQNEKLFILDPEFCFLGFPEFDLAVACAHMSLATQSEEIIQHFLTAYKSKFQYDETVFQPLVGIEILRRLLGVAQLPLAMTLVQKKELIGQSIEWILS